MDPQGKQFRTAKHLDVEEVLFRWFESASAKIIPVFKPLLTTKCVIFVLSDVHYAGTLIMACIFMY